MWVKVGMVKPDSPSPRLMHLPIKEEEDGMEEADSTVCTCVPAACIFKRGRRGFQDTYIPLA